MSKRFVLVLAALVAALGAYVVVFERGSLTSKQLEERKGKVLRSFVRDQVLRLSLTRAGVTLVLERSRDSDGTLSPWKLTAPSAAAADQDAVDRLLGELEWLSPRRVLEKVSAKDREPLGLKAPRFSFSYRVAGVDYQAEVGGKDAQGENSYLALGGEDTVYVVPKTLVEALDYDVGHFRAKEFLGDITSAWAQRLTLQQGEQKIALQKENERWWVLSEPKGFADEQRVARLVAALDGLRAARFVESASKAEALADLARPAQRLELDVIPDTHREDKAPQRFVLRLGGACKGHEGERYALAGDGASSTSGSASADPVCVREEDVAALATDLAELRLMRLFGLDISQIERLELSTGAETWKLKREGEKWLAQGQPAPDREAVEAWLRDLSALRASAVEARAGGLKGPTLALFPASGPGLRIATEPGAQGVRVEREGDALALRFGPELADLLAPFKRRFASLVLWPELQPSQVTGLSARDGKLSRTLTLVDGAWRAKGKGGEPDPQRTRELVREAVKLSAVSAVAERARPEHGFTPASPALTLELGAGKAVSLELGADASTPAGVYARVDGGSVVLLAGSVKELLAELAGAERKAEAGGEGEDAHAHGDHDAHEDDDEHEHEHEHEH